MKKIRTLNPEEIELRVSHVKDGVANHLLFIGSRAATNLLDETYGMENWNLEYKEVNNTIYGRLSIWDEEYGRYVYREDTGEGANISKDKSLASDILKRLIVRFGVSELYTSPKIQIPDDGYGNSGYKVSEISYNENRQITHLVIVNRFNKEVFRWDKDQMSIKPLSNSSSDKQITDNCTTSPNTNKSKKAGLSNEERLIAFRDTIQGKVDDKQLVSFMNFYMGLDNKKNNGRSIADNWAGPFDPQKRFDYWVKNNRTKMKALSVR